MIIEIMTLCLMLNGTVNESCTIENTFEWTYQKMTYEYGYHHKSNYEFINSWTGDCTEAANFVKFVLDEYNIETKRRFGWATCNGHRVRHDWLEHNGVAYDTGGCVDYMVK